MYVPFVSLSVKIPFLEMSTEGSPKLTLHVFSHCRRHLPATSPAENVVTCLSSRHTRQNLLRKINNENFILFAFARQLHRH